MTDRPTPADRALVPPWLVRLAALGWRFLVVLAFGLVLVGLALILSTVTASVVLAVIIAATFAPYVKALRQRGWASTKAAAVVCVAALLIFVAVVALVILAVVPAIVDVVAAIDAGLGALRTALADVAVPAEIVTAIQQFAAAVDDWISSAIASAVESAATVGTVAFLAGFLTFFLLQDGEKAWAWTVSGTSGWRRESLTASGLGALELVGGYLRATAVTAATDAVTNFAFLTILGVPLAGPLAVFVLLGGFVPYIGPVVTTAVLVLVTWATNGLTDVVILLVLIAITNVIQRRFVDPLIYPRTIDVHPALVLIALLIGGTIGGFLGLVAALPVVAFVLTTSRAVVNALDIGPDAPDAAGGVPVWLDRLAQWSWRSLVVIAVMLVGIAAAVTVPTVILPIVLAIVFAATLEPAAARLRQRGWNRSLAAGTATTGAFVIALAVLGLTLISMVAAAAGHRVGIRGWGRPVRGPTARPGRAGRVDRIGDAPGRHDFGRRPGGIHLRAGPCRHPDLLLHARWPRTLGSGDRRDLPPVKRSRLQEAGTGATGVLGGYMIGTGAISLFGAATQFLIMVVLGVPLALPLAVLSFFGGFVPYIGSFITTGLAFLVTVARARRPISSSWACSRSSSTSSRATSWRLWSTARPSTSTRPSSCSPSRPAARSPGSSACSWSCRSLASWQPPGAPC